MEKSNLILDFTKDCSARLGGTSLASQLPEALSQNPKFKAGLGYTVTVSQDR